MTANENDIHQIIQDFGIIVAILIGLGGVIFGLIRKILQKGKELQKKEDEIKDLKLSIDRIELDVQKLEKRADDNEDAIQCIKEDFPKAIGDLREVLARFEGYISKFPSKKNSRHET